MFAACGGLVALLFLARQRTIERGPVTHVPPPPMQQEFAHRRGIRRPPRDPQPPPLEQPRQPRLRLEPAWTHFLKADEIRTAPLVLDDAVVVNAGAVTVIDADGAGAWTDQEFGAGRASTPVEAGELIVCGTSAGLRALRRDGTVAWERRGLAHPAAHGGRIYAASQDRKLVALDAVTGEPAWETPLDAEAQALEADDSVVACAAANALVLLEPSGKIRRRIALDAVNSAPVLQGGRVWVAAGTIRAFDASTGQPLVEGAAVKRPTHPLALEDRVVFPTGEAVACEAWTAPVAAVDLAAHDRWIVAALRDRLALLDPADGKTAAEAALPGCRPSRIAWNPRFGRLIVVDAERVAVAAYDLKPLLDAAAAPK